MAGITRATAQIFSTTGLTGTGGFGAGANGTTTTEAGSSNNLANIQEGTSGEWAGGWLGATLGGSKFPAVEDMNAVDNVFSTQIAYILERGIPEYDAGTTYQANDIVRGVGLTTLYASVGSNVGNPLNNPTYWTFLCDLANLATNVFTGGTTTGSANAQTLASVSPTSGLTPSNGQTIIFTAGFTNTGSATLAITSPSISATAIKKDSGSGLVNLVAGDITVGDTIYVSWNSTSSVWVLTSGLALGTAAYKAASDNTKTNVSSVSGATTVGHVATFADTAGTVQDGGAISSLLLVAPFAIGSAILAKAGDGVGFTAGTTVAAGSLTALYLRFATGNNTQTSQLASGDSISGTWNPMTSAAGQGGDQVAVTFQRVL